MGGFIVVLTVMIGLFVAGHYFLWRRIVRAGTSPGSWARRVGAAAMTVLPLLSLAAILGARSLPFTLERALAWPGYLWAALFFYLLLLALAAEPARLLVMRLSRRRARADDDTPDSDAAEELHSRRKFLARSTGLAAGVAATSIGYGVWAATVRAPTIHRLTVPLAALPDHAEGLRIAVVGDIHLGAITGRAQCRRIVDALNSTDPDVVCMVGDLADGDVADLAPLAEPLADLESRHGVYFVTGNHEYYSGAEQWVDHVRELGMTPLQNEHVALPGLDLAGVNDPAAEINGQPDDVGPDLDAALDGRDASRPVVLMAHQPILVHDAADRAVDLQLSGHTHGGQMWPATYLAGLANPTLAGLERYGDTQLFVTRGAGTWGPPVRVGAEPDVSVLTVTSAD